MAKQRKGYLPALFAENVRAMLGDGTEAALSKAAGISMGSANRVKNGQNVRLDTLQQVAEGFRLEAWEMLMPDLKPEQRPKKRIEALELEVEVLRQQLQDIRAALEKDATALPAPHPDDRRRRGASPGSDRGDPPDRQAKGYEPEGS